MNIQPISIPTGEIIGYRCSECGHCEISDCLTLALEKAESCCICIENNCQQKRAALCTRCSSCHEAYVKQLQRFAQEEAQRRAEVQKEQQTAIKKAKNPFAAECLRDYMASLSEMKYCAGWRYYIEYELWSVTLGNSVTEVTYTKEEEEKLKYLSEQAGGWWYFDEDLKAKKFVAHEEWKKLFQKYCLRELTRLSQEYGEFIIT